MTIAAAMMFTKDLIQGTECVHYPNAPLTAYVAPPIAGDIAKPVAYIWGGTQRESRMAPPRLSGWKTRAIGLDIYVYIAQEANREAGDFAFPTLLEDIAQRLRTAPLPQNIVDPTTQNKFELLTFGEDIATQYERPYALKGQRLVRLGARIQVGVTIPFLESIGAAS